MSMKKCDECGKTKMGKAFPSSGGSVCHSCNGYIKAANEFVEDIELLINGVELPCTKKNLLRSVNENYLNIAVAISNLISKGQRLRGLKRCNKCGSELYREFHGEDGCVACGTNGVYFDGFKSCNLCGKTLHEIDMFRKFIYGSSNLYTCKECESSLFSFRSEHCGGKVSCREYAGESHTDLSILCYDDRNEKSTLCVDDFCYTYGKYKYYERSARNRMTCFGNGDVKDSDRKKNARKDWFVCAKCEFIKRKELKTRVFERSISKGYSSSWVSEWEYHSCCSLCAQKINTKNNATRRECAEIRLNRFKKERRERIEKELAKIERRREKSREYSTQQLELTAMGQVMDLQEFMEGLHENV